MAFEIGDVVQLKSGGPIMTVAEIEDDLIFCRWFDKKEVEQSGAFNQKILTKYDPTAGGA